MCPRLWPQSPPQTLAPECPFPGCPLQGPLPLRLSHIMKIIKKWLSRFARHSAGLFFIVLSSLHRFAAGHFNFGDRRLITRFPSGALPRSQEDIVGGNSPICPSPLPPCRMGLEVAGEPLSSSDHPYTGTNSRPLRLGTAIPSLEAISTTTGYTSVTETDGLHQGSVSTLYLSLEMGESSLNGMTFPKDGLLQESSSPGPSRLSGLHEVPTTHSQPQEYIDDAPSVNTTRTPSMRHLAPRMPYSQPTSDSRISVSTNRSLTRPIAGSEIQQAAYRTHYGPIHYRPANVHSSIAHHGSPDPISVPLDLPVQAVSVPDSGFRHLVHYTAPSCSNEPPGSEVIMVYDGPLTSCMTVDDIRRYERRSSQRAPVVTNITIPAMTLTTHDMTIPQGWTTCVHPEGTRYFVNQEKRTFTEMDIRNPETCGIIERYMQYLLDQLQQSLQQGDLTLDMRQVDLVVEPKLYDGDSVVCCYYFANHYDRCLFWLDDFDPKDITYECKGIESVSHLRLAIEAQYWRHWDYFPSLCPVTQNIIDELKNMLIHATCDHLTSSQSCTPFDVSELRDHLSVVGGIKVHPTPPADQSMQQGHAAVVIGRIMHTFIYNHFTNYHGEDCVRHGSEQTVHGTEYQPSPLMVILAPLLFFGPMAQISELHKIVVDEIVSVTRWNLFSSRLNGQLQDSNLLATVLLNANVGFLAINSVDVSGKSLTQVASYMSLVASMGSMILGLSLVSHNRTMGQGVNVHTAIFLTRVHDQQHGLEKLAIGYSLPKALLIWGMVFFFAAFSVNWWSPGDTSSRAIVGTVIVVVFATMAYNVILIRKANRRTNLLGSSCLAFFVAMRASVVAIISAVLEGGTR